MRVQRDSLYKDSGFHPKLKIQGYYKWFIRFENAIYLKTNESFIVILYN
jgi:hypothetical protein